MKGLASMLSVHASALVPLALAFGATAIVALTSSIFSVKERG
jgi:hypothetical protein